MKNKQGNVAMIVVIVVVVAITAGAVGWMFAKRMQVPAPQVAVVQPAQTKNIQPINVTQPESQTPPVEQATTPAVNAKDEISWQPYTNVKNDFGFEYPGGWIINEKFSTKGYADGIIVKVGGPVNKDTPPFALSVTIIGVVYPNASDAFTSQVEPDLRAGVNHNVTNIKLNGNDAISFTDSGMYNTKNIVLSGRNNILVLSYLAEKENDPTIQKMLSTFKLIK
jgi:hypothetical protein